MRSKHCPQCHYPLGAAWGRCPRCGHELSWDLVAVCQKCSMRQSCGPNQRLTKQRKKKVESSGDEVG